VTTPALSVITVSYQSADTLPRLWRSLAPELGALGCAELFLVDNASTDGSPELLRQIAVEAVDGQPGLSAEVLANPTNVGFARACNQAIARATGRWILLLNPDSVVEPGAIAAAVAFGDSEPSVGILGARVRLPDGRLDAPCRRSFKTPGIYFYKFSGLSRLFPRSRRFGRYYLSYLDEERSADVDAVIGAFMLVRREVIDQIGALDERFFMYCEDEDWCFRAKSAGWRVVYFPDAVVWHRKGASGRTRATRTTLAWHRSLYLFHRKNLAPRYPAWVNGLVYAGMGLGLLAALARSLAATLLSRIPGRLADPAGPERLATSGKS
jgi:GT2 family glycosyltransferase